MISRKLTLGPKCDTIYTILCNFNASYTNYSILQTALVERLESIKTEKERAEKGFILEKRGERK